MLRSALPDPPMDKAMTKDRATQVFLANAAAYVAVMLICAGVNLWLAPETLWFGWVLLGWGIAVATHGLALYLRKTRRKERIFIDQKTRGFTVHAFPMWRWCCCCSSSMSR